MYKKILVTGSSGLVGSYLKDILPKNTTYITSKDYDLTSQKDVKNLYEEIKPDCVVHLAAKVGGILDNLNHPVSYLEDNILINTFMIKYAYENKVKKFIGILSSCAYPDYLDKYPLDESDIDKGPPTNATYSYGMAKRILAHQIDCYNKEFNTEYNYIIPCNIYGGRTNKYDENNSHFITSVLKKINSAKINGDNYIKLYGDGTPLRQFIHAIDVANVIKIVIEKNIIESFNLATKNSISINDITKIILKITNSEDLKILYDITKPNGQYKKDLSIEKFEKLIPNYEFLDIKKGIIENYEKYKQ
jgi:GDP-L-fucose synthase